MCYIYIYLFIYLNYRFKTKWAGDDRGIERAT